jgi:FkbM family methyltransferase
MNYFNIFKTVTKKLQGKNLGAIPGVRQLHRILYTTLRPKGVTETKLFGRRFFVDATDMGEAHEILIHGVFSPFETKIFRDYIKPGMTFVDIGAHIGYFSVMGADSVGSNGKVYAFEPEPKNFSMLKKNIEANEFSNVVLEKCAISDCAGEMTLYIDKKNLGNMSLSSKNIPPEDAGGQVKVKTVTLDEYFKGKSVDYIKIDVQGAEADVFAGGEETLKKANIILLEFWPYGLKNMGADPRTFLQLLERTGFSFYMLNESKHTIKKTTIESLLNISGNRPEGKGWANVLCRKESKS